MLKIWFALLLYVMSSSSLFAEENIEPDFTISKGGVTLEAYGYGQNGKKGPQFYIYKITKAGEFFTREVLSTVTVQHKPTLILTDEKVYVQVFGTGQDGSTKSYLYTPRGKLISNIKV